MGHRIAKHVYDENFQLQKTTYYILDASGNVMATYDKEINYAESKTYFKLKERQIYGSSRVGVRNSDLDVLPLPDKNFSMTTVHYSIGSRTYELSNHLGNVLSVISDKAIPVFPYSNVISEMRADIRVAQDYSPFGVTLDGRNFVVSEGYRYGFNGMESDNEVKGEGNSYNTEFRQYDPRLARWLSPDPLSMVMPSHTPYSFSNNNPIYGNDQDGDICIPCMVLNGLLDLGGQIIGSMAGGSSFSEALGDVSWMSVGWSVLEGASPGAAARRVGKLISNPAIKPYIDEFFGAISDLVSEYIDDRNVNLDQYLKELVFGKAVQTKTRRREHHDTQPVRRALHRQQRLNRTRPSAAARKTEKQLKKQLRKLEDENHFKSNIGGNARKEVLKVVDLSDEKTPENAQVSNEKWEYSRYISRRWDEQEKRTVFLFEQTSNSGEKRMIEERLNVDENNNYVSSDIKVIKQ